MCIRFCAVLMVTYCTISSSSALAGENVASTMHVGCSLEKRRPSSYCEKKMQRFSEAVTAYQACLFKYARPVSYCFNCRDLKHVLNESYAEFVESFLCGGEGSSCRQQFSWMDRIDIFRLGVDRHVGKQSEWEMGYCEACYEGGSQSGVYTAVVQKFLALHEEAEACFDTFRVSEGQKLKKESLIQQWRQDAKIDLEETETQNLQCEVCRKSYREVRDFYDRQLPLKKGAYTLCIDIQEKMNTTTDYWNFQVPCYRSPDLPLYYFAYIPCFVAAFLTFLAWPHILGYLGYVTDHPYDVHQMPTAVGRRFEAEAEERKRKKEEERRRREEEERQQEQESSEDIDDFSSTSGGDDFCTDMEEDICSMSVSEEAMCHSD